MKMFCPEDQPECDLVPCADCHQLFHPLALGERLRCDHCEGAAGEADDA